MAMDDDGDGGARASPVEISAACKRKLVHWVNSLPLASCLLVDELKGLRFGDILWSIVTWLETGEDESSSGQETPNAHVMVTRVVQYVAQKCCAEDRDVMYVIHGAQCVVRVLKGDTEAIAAVLLVLKRLAEEAHARESAQELAEGEERRRELTLEITRHSTSCQSLGRRATDRQNPEQEFLRRRPPPTHDAGLTEPRRTVRRPTKSSLSSMPPKNAVKSPLQPEHRREDRCEVGIPQSPSAPASRKPDQPPQTTDSSLIERCRTVLDWLQLLGVKLPAACSSSKPVDPRTRSSSISSLLKDGVVLCVLAAAIVRRRGSVSVRHKLHSVRSNEGTVYERGVLFVRGATIEPRTQAEKRHNVTVAWDLLKECRMLDVSPSAAITDADTLVRVLWEGGGRDDDGVLLQFLEGVMSQFDRTAVREAEAVSKTDTIPRVSPVLTAIGKRPYITSEQIDVVKKWMKVCGVDPNAISSGILEDSLRNGVAFCELVNRRRTRKDTKIVFKNPPRTLVEVRENIQKAMHALAGKFPLVYATSHAMEGIIMGDKQYIFGILWVFMQLSKDEAVRQHQQRSQHDVGASHLPPPPPPPSPPSSELQPTIPEPTDPMTEPLRREVRPAPRPLSGFDLDVLASDLVEEETRIPSAPLVWASTTAVPWDEAEMHDDIVPFAVLRETPSHEASYDEDITPQKRAPPRVPCDILPVHFRVNDNELEPKLSDPDSPNPDQINKDIAEGTAIMDATRTSPECSSLALKPSPPKPPFSTSQVDQVVKWLTSLGINLCNPQELYTPNAVLTEFQSGVLLCDLVERLEHLRPMEGVCRHDHLAKAQALHNIDKALVVLQSKKVIPLHTVRNKWKIGAGERVAILELLIHTRKAYGSRASRKIKSTKSGEVNQS